MKRCYMWIFESESFLDFPSEEGPSVKEGGRTGGRGRCVDLSGRFFFDFLQPIFKGWRWGTNRCKRCGSECQDLSWFPSIATSSPFSAFH